MIEVWNTVPNYPRYFISNLGNILSNYSGKILSPKIMKSGYLAVNLYTDTGRKMMLVHRLVISTFCGHSEKPVNHIDGDRSNNKVDNLEYTTYRENNNHKFINKKTKYLKGVGFDKKDNRFQSYYSLNGKRTYIGRYKTEIEAHQAYLVKVNEIGEAKYSLPAAPERQGDE